jgi:hypothetical protein
VALSPARRDEPGPALTSARMARHRTTWLAALLAAAALTLALVVMPVGARADGDPASDVLLGENVFYPYSPTVSPAIQKSLNAETTAATRAHFPIKVALIASPVDLGVIPDLFGKPQKYAEFLDQEISFQTKQPLLVVMSTGYGVQGVSSAAANAAAVLRKPAGTQSNDLAQAAIAAVAKLAGAAGHPLPGAGAGAGGSRPGSGGGATIVVVIALAAAAIGAGGAVVGVRRRRSRGR